MRVSRPKSCFASSILVLLQTSTGSAQGRRTVAVSVCCRGGPDCSLMFCTNGVLLRMLTAFGEDPLSEVTHLVSWKGCWDVGV